MNEVLNNIIEQDKDFSEAKFKSKVQNMFVQVKLSMVTGKIQKIDHFVADEVYRKIESKVQSDIDNNRIQIYDELNVANIEIVDVREYEDHFEIDVRLLSRALEYYISRDTRKYLSGNNSSRIEKSNLITFSKIKNAKGLKVLRKCPTCGAVVDINRDGRCEYCHNIFNLEDYDWIITKMDV